MKIDGVELTEGDRVILTGQPRRRSLLDRLLRRPGKSYDGVWVVVQKSTRSVDWVREKMTPPTPEVPDGHCLLSLTHQHLPHTSEDPSTGWFHCDGRRVYRRWAPPPWRGTRSQGVYEMKSGSWERPR